MFKLSPRFFQDYSPYIVPIFSVASLVFFLLGLYYGFFIAPLDYQQKDSVRIMYIHVPAAWLALNLYFTMGILGIGYIIWRNILAVYIMNAAGYIGMFYAAITLITGSLWGKPMWGTYWVWDSRLTSMLILFFFYLGFNYYLAVSEKSEESYFNGAMIAILGAINVPIVKFSVDMWNSLHQPASILRRQGPSIDKSMLTALVIIFLSCIFFTITIIVMRVENSILIAKKRRKLKMEY